MKKITTSIHLVLLFLSIGMMNQAAKAQIVNYKIVHDSPWLPANKPIRAYIDVLAVDLIDGNAAMSLGLRAEYFYKKYGTIRLERRMGYLDGKSMSDNETRKKNLDHFALNDIGATYNFNIKTKRVPVNIVISSKKTEGNKSIKFENEEYMVEGSKGKVSSLRGGIINFRMPTAYDLSGKAWMTTSFNTYIGLSRLTSINLWAESQFGKGGFRNRWGVYGDVIYNLSTKRKDYSRVPDNTPLSAAKQIGYRAGFVYDGVSEAKRPGLGFLSTRLEFGKMPGNIKSFYMNLSTGLCFDLGKKIK